MEVDFPQIGKRIKQKRNEAGFTQEQLAEKLDVSVGYVSQLERGITKISLETLARISVILSGDLAYYVSGTAVQQDNYGQQELLQKFSRLTPEYKRFLLKMLNQLLELPPHK